MDLSIDYTYAAASTAHCLHFELTIKKDVTSSSPGIGTGKKGSSMKKGLKSTSPE
jgi:hypothetical protein